MTMTVEIEKQCEQYSCAIAGGDCKDILMNRGLPLFKNPLASTNIGFDGYHFERKCLSSITKVKSRIVQQILKLGYEVSICRNAFPFLNSFGPGMHLAYFDEYKKVIGGLRMARYY